jgi:tetratricopeptide (TPR) repeat protein
MAALPISTLPAKGDFWSSITPQLRDTITSTVSNSELKQITERPNAPATFTTLQSLALNFERQGNYEVAEEILQGIISGSQHEVEKPERLWAMHYLGLVQLQLGKYVESEETYRSLVELQERLNGKGDRSSWAAMSNLGVVLNKEGNYAEAEEVLGLLLPKLQNHAGVDHPKALGCMRHLMTALGGQGKFDEAMEMNMKGMDIAMKMSDEHQASEIEEMEEMGRQLERWKQDTM